ncbi:hypothetical protein [Cytobacillus dafuensis]|nr:hypothetical protein [Cytobacillus dafuensis]
MRKMTILGIVLVLIGIGITIFGLTVSSDLGEKIGIFGCLVTY